MAIELADQGTLKVSHDGMKEPEQGDVGTHAEEVWSRGRIQRRCHLMMSDLAGHIEKHYRIDNYIREDDTMGT